MNQACDWWGLGILLFELLVGGPPFSDPNGNEMATYMNITRGDLTGRFPTSPKVSADACAIIRGLLTVRMAGRLGGVPACMCSHGALSPQVRVAERLGYLKGGASDVMGHPWLASFDFDGLVNMTLSPPWVPNLSASDDCSYFDPDLRAEDESKDSSKSGAAAGSSSSSTSTKTVKGVYTQGKGKPIPKFAPAEEEAWAKLCTAYASPF